MKKLSDNKPPVFARSVSDPGTFSWQISEGGLCCMWGRQVCRMWRGSRKWCVAELSSNVGRRLTPDEHFKLIIIQSYPSVFVLEYFTFWESWRRENRKYFKEGETKYFQTGQPVVPVRRCQHLRHSQAEQVSRTTHLTALCQLFLFSRENDVKKILSSLELIEENVSSDIIKCVPGEGINGYFLFLKQSQLSANS